MHHKTKAALMAKYADLIEHGTTKEEIIDFLATEEKAETQEDKDELLAELFPEKGSEKKVIKAVKPHYEEWDVKVGGGKAEKLKISRPVVKISEEEADTLNAGILTGGNTYAKMYFLPE